MPEWLQFALTVLVGVGTGILSGMFGIGGAIVSNPSIRALGAAPLESVGSTLPSIIPSALSGAHRYRRAGLLRLRVVAWTGFTGAVTSIGGAVLAELTPEPELLTIAIAVLVGYTALRLARGVQQSAGDVSDAELVADVRDEWWRLAAIGAVVGLFSGLLGIGGGVLMVPAFTTFVRIPLKETLGTSLACAGIIAVPGVVTHALLGNINWAFAVPLCIGVVPGARIGANITIGAADRTLRIAVASVLGVIAVTYAVSEVVILLR